MTININCKNARDAISQIGSALGTDLENIYVKFGKEKMRISASGSSLSLRIEVADCSGKGKFGINAESFKRILSRRTTLECKLNDSMLTFKQGTFKGEVTTFPYIEVEVQPEESDKTIAIPHNSGLAQHFNRSRSHLALSNSLAQDKEPFLSVIVENGQLDCLVYDPLHAGLYSSPIDYEGSFEFNILDSTLRKIAAMTKKEEGYNLLIGESSVFVESENIKASITMTQNSAKEARPLLDMMAKMQKDKNVQASAILPAEGLEIVVENMMGIVESQKVIDLQVKKNGVYVKYETSYGKVEEEFETKSKGKEKVAITPDILQDILDVIPSSEVSMLITVHPDSRNKTRQLMLSIPDENLTYVMLVK